MDKIRVSGGTPLSGTLPVSGAKNAALPLMIASLLSREPLVLDNVARLNDTALLKRILGNHGVNIMVGGRTRDDTEFAGERLTLSCPDLTNLTAPYDLVSKMRASFWVIGPLLARAHAAKVSLPGGCAIGTRPVDLFLDGLRQMGAELEVENGYVDAKAPKGLQGAEIIFPKVSVGATHTLMMAATLAKGTTILRNAAREPEIVDLAECLIKMGAKITGHGRSDVTIEGVEVLHGATHSVIPDRIETGTFMMAAAAAGGDVTITHCVPEHLRAAKVVLESAGAQVDFLEGAIRVRRDGPLKPVDVETAPYPGFPTDVQAQLMALLCLADGRSRVRETIFENRFMHVQELVRLGANIEAHGDTALVTGPTAFKGAEVMATDLRASVSLVIAAMAAEGETLINRVYHLDRGFERLEDKLNACGAKIERIRG